MCTKYFTIKRKRDENQKFLWKKMCSAIYLQFKTLKLQKRDKHHIEKFKLALNSEHPIHDGVDLKGNQYSSFYIGSKKLAKQLKKIGVVPKKTFIVKFPKLSSRLISHFIRGYFDDDGCMYVNNKYHTWSIYSSSIRFIEKLFNIIKKETKLHFNMYNSKNISCSKKNDLIALEKYLYKDATIFLERKREKFLKIIS